MSKTKKEVIVVQSKEGCFLQTMNIGCVILLIMFAIITVLAIMGSIV